MPLLRGGAPRPPSRRAASWLASSSPSASSCSPPRVAGGLPGVVLAAARLGTGGHLLRRRRPRAPGCRSTIGRGRAEHDQRHDRRRHAPARRAAVGERDPRAALEADQLRRSPPGRRRSGRSMSACRARGGWPSAACLRLVPASADPLPAALDARCGWPCRRCRARRRRSRAAAARRARRLPRPGPARRRPPATTGRARRALAPARRLPARVGGSGLGLGGFGFGLVRLGLDLARRPARARAPTRARSRRSPAQLPPARWSRPPARRLRPPTRASSASGSTVLGAPSSSSGSGVSRVTRITPSSDGSLLGQRRLLLDGSTLVVLPVELVALVLAGLVVRRGLAGNGRRSRPARTSPSCVLAPPADRRARRARRSAAPG